MYSRWRKCHDDADACVSIEPKKLVAKLWISIGKLEGVRQLLSTTLTGGKWFARVTSPVETAQTNSRSSGDRFTRIRCHDNHISQQEIYQLLFPPTSNRHTFFWLLCCKISRIFRMQRLLVRKFHAFECDATVSFALKISSCTKISCVRKVGGPQHTKIWCVRNILDLQYVIKSTQS